MNVDYFIMVPPVHKYTHTHITIAINQIYKDLLFSIWSQKLASQLQVVNSVKHIIMPTVCVCVCCLTYMCVCVSQMMIHHSFQVVTLPQLALYHYLFFAYVILLPLIFNPLFTISYQYRYYIIILRFSFNSSRLLVMGWILCRRLLLFITHLYQLLTDNVCCFI